jgi:hypothetical protein
VTLPFPRKPSNDPLMETLLWRAQNCSPAGATTNPKALLFGDFAGFLVKRPRCSVCGQGSSVTHLHCRVVGTSMLAARCLVNTDAEGFNDKEFFRSYVLIDWTTLIRVFNSQCPSFFTSLGIHINWRSCLVAALVSAYRDLKHVSKLACFDLQNPASSGSPVVYFVTWMS